jgi:tetratricopeptide (TPR) repeat protein
VSGPEAARAPETHPGKPGPTWRSRARTARWILLAAAVVGAAVPSVLLEIGTRRARSCIASYAEPRGPALPDCRAEMKWFATPSRIPWTAIPARYRAEELGARIAIAEYTDALVGHPDRAGIDAGAPRVDAAAKALATGSRRLGLEELGHTVGAPDLGRTAEIYGDRGTLLARFDEWTEWHMRLRALESAWMEGDVARAQAIAKRYAEFDPRDDDLRTAVGATLCLGDAQARGIALLASVQYDRAAQRHESWARNWGDERAAMVACSARAKVPPPAAPDHGDGGQGDAVEARTALRLRLLSDPGQPAERRSEADAATMALLREARSPGARVRLLAALIDEREELDPKEMAELAAPRGDGGEPPIGPSPARTAIDWLDAHRGLEASVPGATLRGSAARIRALATHASLSRDEARALRAAAGAMTLEAARALALEGNGEAAAATISDSGDALPSEAARALQRACAWYVAGNAERALAALNATSDVGAADQAVAREVRVAAAIQRAELLASLGRRDEAAKAAIAADELAPTAGSRALDAHARWTRLALARPPLASQRPGEAAVVGDARAWPWVGLTGRPTSWLVPEAEAATPLGRALAFWDAAAAASPEQRRALRYAAIDHRGDAPLAAAAYYAIAAELLRAGEGDVEIWLDVFSATDARRLPLRTYAWLRAESARFRGDPASAARWTTRLRALTAVTADPAKAEIARYLGL